MKSHLNIRKSWKRHFYNRDCKTLIFNLPVIRIIISLDTKHVNCTIIDILDNLCLMVDPKMLLWESVDFLSDFNLCIQCLPLLTCQRRGKQNCDKDNQEVDWSAQQISKARLRTSNLWPHWFCQCLRETTAAAKRGKTSFSQGSWSKERTFQ